MSYCLTIFSSLIYLCYNYFDVMEVLSSCFMQIGNVFPFFFLFFFLVGIFSLYEKLFYVVVVVHANGVLDGLLAWPYVVVEAARHCDSQCYFN